MESIENKRRILSLIKNHQQPKQTMECSRHDASMQSIQFAIESKLDADVRSSIRTDENDEISTIDRLRMKFCRRQENNWIIHRRE